jgi:CRP-like cAMP-binding protein
MHPVFRQHLEKVIELTDEEYDYISSHFTNKKLKKHNFVIQEGLPVNHEYFVISGLLKASYLNEQGKEHILQFGNACGEDVCSQ